MSELASSIGVPDAVGTEVDQSYVYVMNLDSSEFPVIVEARGIGSTIQPISVTLTDNGVAALGTPDDSKIDRRVVRVTVTNPGSTTTAPPPLYVDTLVLHPNEIEPPITIATQYIRVVIRSIIIPQTEKP
jgi:hypothetical protein